MSYCVLGLFLFESLYIWPKMVVHVPDASVINHSGTQPVSVKNHHIQRVQPELKLGLHSVHFMH